MEKSGDVPTSVCYVCCKLRKDSVINKKSEKSSRNPAHSFTLLERYLRLQSGLLKFVAITNEFDTDQNFRIQICSSCDGLLGTFCDLYDKVKCLELQLKWKAETIIRIMKESGRVPSRMRALKDTFEQQKHSTGQNDLDCQGFLQSRHRMVKIGSKTLLAFPPKVLLERIKSENDLQGSGKETICADNMFHPNDDQFMKFWIMSFAAVVTLLLPEQQNNCVCPKLPAEATGETMCPHIHIDNSEDDALISYGDEKQSVYSNSSSLENETETRKSDIVLENHTNYSEIESDDNNQALSLDAASVHSSDSEDDSQVPHVEQKIIVQVIKREKSPDSELRKELVLEANPEADGLAKIDISVPSVSEHYTRKERHLTNKPFCCKLCCKLFANRRTFNCHMRTNHPEIWKARNPVPPKRFHCKVCDKGFPSFRAYFLHTKCYEHCRKLKIQKVKPPSRETETCPSVSIDHYGDVETRNSVAPDHAQTETAGSSTSQPISSFTPKYNLRRKQVRLSLTSTSNDTTVPELPHPDTDFKIDHEDDWSESSSSSISDESDSNSTRNKKSRKHYHKTTSRYYCRLDGCKYYARSSYVYQEHMKLHKHGNYNCSFCETVETSALKLSMHELSQHSKITPDKADNTFYCPRCPFQGNANLKLLYANHFASCHLGFPKLGWMKCPICYVDISIKSERKHFANCHDTSNVDSNKVLNCDEEGCTAHFITQGSFRKHQQELHKIDELHCSSDENDDNSDTQAKFVCKFCKKEFTSHIRLKLYNQSFHRVPEKNPGNDGLAKTKNNFYICPVAKCTKTFKTTDILNKHKKLHGKFQCQFCPVVMDYAPDLPFHELEHVKSDKNDKVVKCTRCISVHPKIWFITHFLESHMELTNRIVQCSVCPEKFETLSGLKHHFISHHKLDGNDSATLKNCNSCTAYFLKESQLHFHQQTCAKPAIASNNNEISETSKCKVKTNYCSVPECLESFKYPEELESHIKLHGNFKCNFCQFEANYCPDLATHEQNEHGTESPKSNSLKCSRCSFTTKVKARYQCHFLETHFDLDYKVLMCPICKARFVNVHAISRHKVRNHKIDAVDPKLIERCDQCSAYFLAKFQLLQHKRRVHEGLDDTSFKCVQCGKLCNSRQSLLEHQRRKHRFLKSSALFEYPCDLPDCTKRFETESDLIWHKRFVRHEKKNKAVVGEMNQPITCEKCGKSCKGIGAYKSHMYVHTRKKTVKEFKCDQCDKVFKFKGSLQHHQEFHKGPEEWKFMCAVCSKKCVTKAALDQHMNTHTKAKPFVCQVCGAKYAHRHNLRNHVNKNHKDEGVQDIAKKVNRKYFVSRKGKKLGDAFCFTRENNKS